MRPEPTEQDRKNWARNAYEWGYGHPDDPNPYKKNTTSWDAWRTGREHRLMDFPMLDLPFHPTALSKSFTAKPRGL